MRRLLAATSSLALATSAFADAPPIPPMGPAQYQFYAPPNGPSTVIQNEFNRLHGLTQWRPIVQRSTGLGPAVNPSVTNGWQALSTSRINFINQTRTAVSALRLRYCNTYSGVSTLPGVGTGSGGEVVAANPITVYAGVFLNSNLTKLAWSYNDGSQGSAIPVTFNGGQNSVTIPGGYCVASDPTPVYIAAGQGFYIQSTCNEPVGKLCPGTETTPVSGQTAFDGNNAGWYNIGLTGNGAQTTFTYTAPAAYIPIIAGSFNGAAPGSGCCTHDSGGVITPGNGIASGTINYSTGAVSITFSSPIPNGTTQFVNTVGGTPTEQSKTTLTAFGLAAGSNALFGPQSIEGLPVGNAPLRALGIMGDSIDNGSGNTITNVSWIDYSNPSANGVVKGAVSGEELVDFAQINGRISRMRYLGDVDRVIANFGTNDIYYGQSISQAIANFEASQPSLAALTPDRIGADLWWVTTIPRTNSSNVAVVPGSGPYTAAGAAYGSGAVVNPTPLGGGYSSGVLGNAILTCPITGAGTTGPYTCTFSAATMPGSLWSDGAYTSVIDSGSGGTGATTLTGSQLSTGTHTPSTGAISLTFTNALASGKVVNLYAFATGPSARNAWNYWLYNAALPLGLVGGVVDLASCLENTPASATGAGTGLWLTPLATYTADDTHPSANAHQTLIPGCLGPNGTNPSPFFGLN